MPAEIRHYCTACGSDNHIAGNDLCPSDPDGLFHARLAAMEDQAEALDLLDARYHDHLPEGANCRLCGVLHAEINPR